MVTEILIKGYRHPNKKRYRKEDDESAIDALPTELVPALHYEILSGPDSRAGVKVHGGPANL